MSIAYVVVATDEATPHTPEVSVFGTRALAEKCKQVYIEADFADGDDESTDADCVTAWVSIETHTIDELDS